MVTRLKDIKYSTDGTYWELDSKDAYVVMKNGVTHSTSVQAFRRDEDGLSCAVAYCKYLEKRR